MKRPVCRTVTRREAIGLLGASVGLSVGVACRKGPEPSVDRGKPSGAAVPPATFPQDAVIRTILEDVSPEALDMGATLFHEHLQLGFGYYSSPPADMRSPGGQPSAAETAEFLDLVVDELRMISAEGVGCVVDAAIGRRSDWELENLRQMADRSQVHIVVAGAYFKAPYPEAIAGLTEDQIAEHLVQDAFAQRWGAFGEVGTSMEMHPDERTFLRAISRAHLRTGLPIFTHTEHEGCASCALEQLDLLEAQGVEPRHLCIGHLSDITQEEDPDSRTHKAIADRGAFLGFDTVGRALGVAPPRTSRAGKLPAEFSDIPEAQKVRRILSVLDAGHEDYVLLSSDFSSAVDLKANWGNGFSTALVQFVPKLRHAGVDETTLRKILIDNPRRFLAFVPAST